MAAKSILRTTKPLTRSVYSVSIKLKTNDRVKITPRRLAMKNSLFAQNWCKLDISVFLLLTVVDLQDYRYEWLVYGIWMHVCLIFTFPCSIYDVVLLLFGFSCSKIIAFGIQNMKESGNSQHPTVGSAPMTCLLYG